MKENLLLLKDLLEPWKKTYTYISSVSKNVYIDKLDDIVNKYNNTYLRTIKMEPFDVNPNMYFDFNKKIIRKIT